jgi:hypothetical protein
MDAKQRQTAMNHETRERPKILLGVARIFRGFLFSIRDYSRDSRA